MRLLTLSLNETNARILWLYCSSSNTNSMTDRFVKTYFPISERLSSPLVLTRRFKRHCIYPSECLLDWVKASVERIFTTTWRNMLLCAVWFSCWSFWPTLVQDVLVRDQRSVNVYQRTKQQASFVMETIFVIPFISNNYPMMSINFIWKDFYSLIFLLAIFRPLCISNRCILKTMK